MDKFIVSARKYRPQNFNTVVGQSHITTTLKNAIRNNQLAHAFLFCGPRGVGKTTCARILAKTINCTNQTPEGEACNTCNSCVSFDAGSSMNIHELDAASNNSVDDIRSLVEQVRFAPQAGKYKVYIVDEVHMLTTSAFNAFLKTLEEPPPYAIFILATTEKHKILPTILSRCQIFDFKRITTNDTVEHLEEIIGKEGVHAEKAALQIIAQKSEGCMRDALSILDKIVSFTSGEVNYQNTLEHLNILDHDYYFKLLEALQQQDMAGGMLLYDEINRKGFEGDMVLNGFAEFIRNILVCKDARAIQLLDVVEGMQEKYRTVAASVNAGYLVSALNILNEAEVNFKMARNKRLHVELVIIKLNFLQQAIELSVQDGNLVRKKRVDGPVAIQYKPIASIQIKTPPATVIPMPNNIGKLYVEEKPAIQQKAPAQEYAPATSPMQPYMPETQYATTTQTILQPPPMQVVKPVPAPPMGDGKRNILDALRAKYGDRYSVQVVEEPIPLTMETLQAHWDKFTNKLKEDNQVSVGNAFYQATLLIQDEATFTICINSNLQQRFIEQEKTMMLEYLQRHYHNNSISFNFQLNEGTKDEVPVTANLNSKQRFERIAEQYPLLRELRDKLKLELDY
ncbi:DNA polymerase III subunit gamma/tau [Parasediminibacterium sp. JCM 36343]|uniref:DNA polymerase III subunit gamma/tau n=1 Tax=Parasediminibacterium sp. JCM 36343 TaxID=3374279 RepID=UPI00397ACC50